MKQNCDILRLREAVQAEPQSPEAWKALATCLAETGQRRSALEAYRHSLELVGGGDERALSVMRFLESLPIVKDENPVTSRGIQPDLSPLTGVSLPVWFQVFLGLFSFLLMLLTAVAQDWTATEMVWSLWISSLVLGYSFIITAILAMFFGGKERGAIGQISSAVGKSSVVLRLLGAVFMLAFFSFHFLFFHFVHSVFLNQFFPLVRSEVFGGIGEGYFVNVVATCIRRFWPFVLTSALSQLGKFVRAFQQIDSSLLSMPYKNVIRMHLSIFVFAFLHITGVPSVALYFVMFVYFFPLRDLWNFLRGSSKKTIGTPA
jgi:Family of unknown function (DUF6498)